MIKRSRSKTTRCASFPISGSRTSAHRELICKSGIISSKGEAAGSEEGFYPRLYMADGGPGGLLDSWCPFCCSRLFLLSSSSCCCVLLLQLLRIRQCMEPLCSCSLWQWRCCGLRQGESQYFRKPTALGASSHCVLLYFLYFCICSFSVRQ